MGHVKDGFTLTIHVVVSQSQVCILLRFPLRYHTHFRQTVVVGDGFCFLGEISLPVTDKQLAVQPHAAAAAAPDANDGVVETLPLPTFASAADWLECRKLLAHTDRQTNLLFSR